MFNRFHFQDMDTATVAATFKGGKVKMRRRRHIIEGTPVYGEGGRRGPGPLRLQQPGSGQCSLGWCCWGQLS